LDLLLVRHAIAAERDAEHWPDDGERPLTPRGVARFARAARGLSRIAPPVELVLASPMARAWHTAELLEREAGWPAPRPCEPLEAGRPPSDALAALQSEGGRSSVAAVGHEPGLSLLASLLLTGDPYAARLELKKGAAALLAFPREPAAGEALLVWSVAPKTLRSLAR